MVRLKATCRYSAVYDVRVFQFHYGSIKGTNITEDA